MTKDCIF